jgi:predicted phosphoribosyltransferase
VALILNKFFGKFQLKIKNRGSAGNILAVALKDILKKVAGSDIIVVGIPRGGFIIAEVIARKLGCNLDMVISKRLRAPHNEEMAIGAVAEDGTTYLNNALIEELKISDEYIDKELSYQLQEIMRLSKMYYRGMKTLLDGKYITNSDKTIVIVDDGAATGSTIIATLRSLRKKYRPKCIIVALTVTPRGTVDLLRREGIDHIEVVTSPSDNNFGTIEQFYQNFDQVSDDEILDIINNMRR